MSFKIQLLGILDKIPRDLKWEAEGITVRQLIDELAQQYGEESREFLLENNELRNGLGILLNGRSIYSHKGLETVLHEGDDLFITILAIGG